MSERSIPNTPLARRRRIVEILTANRVGSQAELQAMLSSEGLEVTQGTLSRDLEEVRATKTRREDGGLAYVVPAAVAAGAGGGSGSGGDGLDESRLGRLCEELLVSAVASANLVVVRTPPGAAQFFASALDLSLIEGVLGTIAGDDTMLIITADPVGGAGIAHYLMGLAEGGSAR